MLQASSSKSCKREERTPLLAGAASGRVACCGQANACLSPQDHGSIHESPLQLKHHLHSHHGKDWEVSHLLASSSSKKKLPGDVPPCSITSASTIAAAQLCTSSAPQWWCFWDVRACSNRFFLLLLMSCIPLGGHFVKNCLSSLEPFMLNDPEFPLSNTMFGAILSSVSIPNMILPLFGGRLLDKGGHRQVVYFLLWICLGHLIFTYGMQSHSLWMALFGRVVFGIGEGSVVVASRTIIAFWFRDRDLTFAMGMSVAVTNVGKMLAKASVAPIALYFGSYVMSLYAGLLVCLVSVVIAVIVCAYTHQIKKFVKHICREQEKEAQEDLEANLAMRLSHELQEPPNMAIQQLEQQLQRQRQDHDRALACGNCWLYGLIERKRRKIAHKMRRKQLVLCGMDYNDTEACQRAWKEFKKEHKKNHKHIGHKKPHKHFRCSREVFGSFSCMFWLLTLLHVVFVNVFHMFQNVSSSYFHETYGFSVVKSGFVSSLSHVFVILAPLMGLLIDRFGGRKTLVLISSLMTILAYGLMLFTEVSPVVSMLLISLCLSFTPTILFASIPKCVDRKALGSAFGAVEIMDAFGATFGNLLIGWLRDRTGSYRADMVLLFSMAVGALALSVSLFLQDCVGNVSLDHQQDEEREAEQAEVRSMEAAAAKAAQQFQEQQQQLLQASRQQPEEEDGMRPLQVVVHSPIAEAPRRPQDSYRYRSRSMDDDEFVDDPAALISERGSIDSLSCVEEDESLSASSRSSPNPPSSPQNPPKAG